MRNLSTSRTAAFGLMSVCLIGLGWNQWRPKAAAAPVELGSGPLLPPKLVSQGTSSPDPSVAAWVTYRVPTPPDLPKTTFPISSWRLYDESGTIYRPRLRWEGEQLTFELPKGYDRAPRRLTLEITQRSGLTLPLPFPTPPLPHKLASPARGSLWEGVALKPFRTGDVSSLALMVEVIARPNPGHAIVVSSVGGDFASSAISHTVTLDGDAPPERPPLLESGLDGPLSDSNAYFRVAEYEARPTHRRLTFRVPSPVQRFGEDWFQRRLGILEVGEGATLALSASGEPPKRTPRHPRKEIGLELLGIGFAKWKGAQLVTPVTLGQIPLKLTPARTNILGEETLLKTTGGVPSTPGAGAMSPPPDPKARLATPSGPFEIVVDADYVLYRKVRECVVPVRFDAKTERRLAPRPAKVSGRPTPNTSPAAIR